jgi:hypothetical protein
LSLNVDDRALLILKPVDLENLGRSKYWSESPALPFAETSKLYCLDSFSPLFSE